MTMSKSIHPELDSPPKPALKTEPDCEALIENISAVRKKASDFGLIVSEMTSEDFGACEELEALIQSYINNELDLYGLRYCRDGNWGSREAKGLAMKYISQNSWAAVYLMLREPPKNKDWIYDAAGKFESDIIRHLSKSFIINNNLKAVQYILNHGPDDSYKEVFKVAVLHKSSKVLTFLCQDYLGTHDPDYIYQYIKDSHPHNIAFVYAHCTDEQSCRWYKQNSQIITRERMTVTEQKKHKIIEEFNFASGIITFEKKRNEEFVLTRSGGGGDYIEKTCNRPPPEAPPTIIHFNQLTFLDDVIKAHEKLIELGGQPQSLKTLTCQLQKTDVIKLPKPMTKITAK